MSPKKKRPKLTKESESESIKRESEAESSSCKRLKTVKNAEEDLQTKKRKNFVTACEQVSYNAYFDHRSRLLLMYLPECLNTTICRHQDSNSTSIKAMSSTAEETFMIDARTNMWAEALEVCIMVLTPQQYLSTNVLKEVVEIILNAHEDQYAENPVTYVLTKSQQVLMNNFSLHPPCFMKRLRKCYNDFLTSPMNLKDKTFTNRSEFGCDKGLVKYCMNRLEYEISAESKDEPLVDKYENIPEEMKQSVKGLHWQKEKFEIYELLERHERIERLMIVLETIIELLQFDLAIWQTRYTNNLGNHIMRSHKPLMAFVLWSNNILYTGAVNNNCRQILRLFANIVHLRYSERHINIMTLWLNTVIQTFYICETNSNSDYPNTGKYCTAFANEFYKIIEDLPHDSIIRILETVKPSYMRHLMGMLHVKNLLSTDENCIIKNLITFIKKANWNNYPESDEPLEISLNNFFKPVNAKREFRKLMKLLSTYETSGIPEDDEVLVYPKLSTEYNHIDLNRNHVVHTLFITLEAYLDAYSVQNVQETLDNLNEQLLNSEPNVTMENTFSPEIGSYTVTEHFIKKYRSIYQMLKDLVLLFQMMKSEGDLSEILNVFKNIELLSL